MSVYGFALIFPIAFSAGGFVLLGMWLEHWRHPRPRPPQPRRESRGIVTGIEPGARWNVR